MLGFSVPEKARVSWSFPLGSGLAKLSSTVSLSLRSLTLALIVLLPTLAIAQVFRYAVDAIKAGEPPSYLRGMALTLIALALGGAVFRALSRIHIFYAARDVELDLRCAFYRHLSTLEPDFFVGHPIGDLM